MREITSRSNPLVRKLRGAADGREYALLEGRKFIREVFESGMPLPVVAAAQSAAPAIEEFLLECAAAGSDVITLPDRLLAEVSDVVTCQGLVALAAPRRTDLQDVDFEGVPLAVVLDGLQDPGNVGALARSALAFGAEVLVLLKGCANPYGAKALRASAGAALKLQVVVTESTMLASWMAGRGIRGVGLDPRGRGELGTYDFREPCAIIIGSEGAGISSESAGLAHEFLRIPTKPGVESLNAAVSGAIALYEAARRRQGSG